ncbi:calcium-binding protein [Maritimibacter sp. DP1N21-5]|uniref:calcium-binding protein n=1 Tax=Maritimibacter sp. DP1N21-5 TaxID=2836867 RepID=UPI001C45B3E4|nr:calcium-binding protein [Maritimibacter sp. DP1N21-5]MBV7407911.1 hypothetical protein [Maritimibacter sp. DP1N21-5]
MGIAFLLLGLVPLLFLGGSFMGDMGEDDPLPEGELDQVRTVDLSEVLYPKTGDGEPGPVELVDPDSVLLPVTDDGAPGPVTDVDPATVVTPTDAPGEGLPGPGDLTALQRLMLAESDFSLGTADLPHMIGIAQDIALTDGTDLWDAPRDATAGNGAGILADHDGTPILSGGSVTVVEGGAGTDAILGGDGALYGFGGAGDDILVGGDGTAALFGGTGNDLLAAGEGAAFLDGGSGDDVVAGGSGDDVLSGGTHDAASADQQDDDRIAGGDGNDHLRGGYGADQLFGGAGDDVIDHLGRVEEDVAWGTSRFDWHLDGAADVLDGGVGDDTLIMGREDVATGGEGVDSFILYFDPMEGAGFADITDFVPGTDFLRVELNPGAGYVAPEVAVTPSDDGADAVVTVDGGVVAFLRGAPHVTLADVLVEVMPDRF